jgi:hypothetical protein
MTTNYVPLIIESIFRGLAIDAHAIWQAALANPWIFVVFAAAIMLPVVVRPSRRRRRGY